MISINRILILTALSGIIIVSSCKKDKVVHPEACFTSDSSLRKPEEVINFKNCSKDYDRSEWNFGDGESSTISDPSHKFKDPGYYTVSLRVFKGTDSKTIEKKVIIAYSPKLNFKADLSGFHVPAGTVSLSYNVYSSTNSGQTYNLISQHYSPGPNWHNIAAGAVAIADANVKYRFKVVIKGSGSATITPDSLITPDINVIDAPQITGSAKLNVVDANYNTNLLYY